MQSLRFRRAAAAALAFVAVLAARPSSAARLSSEAVRQRVAALIESVHAAADPENPYEALFPPRAEAIAVEFGADGMTIVFNAALGTGNWTPSRAEKLWDTVREALGDAIAPDEPLNFAVDNDPRGGGTRIDFKEFVTYADQVRARHSVAESAPLAAPVVRRVDYAGPATTGGFDGRNLVVGPSHGWLWHKENRWQFQRARLLTTIEDLFPASYVNPFLIPMLENAGAIVWSVRERDYQTAEVIVDNDEQTARSQFSTEGEWAAADAPGWRGGVPAALTPDDEPFLAGTTLRAVVDPEAPAGAKFTPFIPRTGRYAVYASWTQDASNSPAVPIEVRHRGGTTRFTVNQQVAGGTWVFLGFFEFEKPEEEEETEPSWVMISTEGAASSGGEGPTYVSVDAVRFGGGIGNVASGGQPSGKPRHAEGARYWLQYSGAPKVPFWGPELGVGHFGLDYNRDIAARAEWSNWLMGAPNGPNSDRAAAGLGVPIEVALSWHTDAGIDPDGLIGTLSIYNDLGDEADREFPDGRSRMLNRDLMQILQEEIVRTLRANYSSTWARRDIRKVGFGEARRPNVPSGILELLSHQNFNDMKYGLDPRFKFDSARAVYKALLRFVAYSHGFEPVVAPLAPTHLFVDQHDGGVRVSWRGQIDPIEPTAAPDGFIVYRSDDGHAFDNGTYVSASETGADSENGGLATIYYMWETIGVNKNHFFRVTAVNAGGESFPSSIVGVRSAPKGTKPVLIVDGFQRIAGPAILEGEKARGFDRATDPGVGYHYNYGLVGDQYDFDTSSDWKNDLETPGWGASRANMQSTLELGNTFDHVVPHGEAIVAAGRGFDSMTLDAFIERFGADENRYGAIDWIAGEQRRTPPFAGLEGEGAPDRMTTEFEVLPAAAMQKLEAYLASGGSLLISGAYIAEDVDVDATRAFLRDRLGVAGHRDHATNINTVHPSGAEGAFAALPIFRFGHDLDRPINLLPTVYPVESAEGFEVGPGASGVLVYGDSDLVSAVAGEQHVLLGFPLETVQPVASRQALMAAALDHLGK